jgi:hypothetical protein
MTKEKTSTWKSVQKYFLTSNKPGTETKVTVISNKPISKQESQKFIDDLLRKQDSQKIFDSSLKFIGSCNEEFKKFDDEFNIEPFKDSDFKDF